MLSVGGRAMSTASARSGISCNHCHHSFALKDAGIVSDAAEALPDPFALKCPLCGEEGTYSKASIGRIVPGGFMHGGGGRNVPKSIEHREKQSAAGFTRYSDPAEAARTSDAVKRGLQNAAYCDYGHRIRRGVPCVKCARLGRA